MAVAFAISDEDIRHVLAGGGVNVSLEKAERYRCLLNQARVEKAALYGVGLDLQTTYAHAEIRMQLAESGLFDDAVAEWVGLHYRRNFDMESQARKREWRVRWAEMMGRASI